jgi:hypothetical protein
MEATVLTDENIRQAIKKLKEVNLHWNDKVLRHNQHKKKDSQIWAIHGCYECLKRLNK